MKEGETNFQGSPRAADRQYLDAAGPPIVRFERLTKKFGSTVALDNVDVELPCGAIALLGRNGAGKSTMLNVLSGVVLPTSGRALVGDYLAASSEASKIVGRQPEFPNSASFMSRRKLERHLLLSHDERSELARLLERFEVPDRSVRRLSRGNQLKLALAVSFSRMRQVLLLDEPTSGLDVFGVEILSELIRERTSRGLTTLVATHQPTLTPELFGHVVVIDLGRVLYAGDLESLLAVGGSDPGEAATARLAAGLATLIQRETGEQA